MPLKNNLADDVYIVTTCDPMAIYAANNICKGIKKFAQRGQVYLGGLIYNGRSAIEAPFIILNTLQLCCGDGHETDLRMMRVIGIDDRINACKPLCL